MLCVKRQGFGYLAQQEEGASISRHPGVDPRALLAEAPGPRSVPPEVSCGELKGLSEVTLSKEEGNAQRGEPLSPVSTEGGEAQISCQPEAVTPEPEQEQKIFPFVLIL